VTWAGGAGGVGGGVGLPWGRGGAGGGGGGWPRARWRASNLAACWRAPGAEPLVCGRSKGRSYTRKVLTDDTAPTRYTPLLLMMTLIFGICGKNSAMVSSWGLSASPLPNPTPKSPFPQSPFPLGPRPWGSAGATDRRACPTQRPSGCGCRRRCASLKRHEPGSTPPCAPELLPGGILRCLDA